MKNFNFKKAFKALAVIGIFTVMFTLVHVFLPQWVFWTALAAFILLCFYLAGREEPHYWAFFVFRRDGNNSIGVFKTDERLVTFPDSTIENYAQMTGLSVFEISESYYEAMRKAILNEKQKDNDTDTDNQR